jgi:signal transduction histidine kinase
METLSALFSEQSFMPHGHCYLWTPSMLWLQVLTNAIIGLSYVAISATLVGFMQRVEELPLRFLYVAFGVFIIACGITHFMDVWVIWEPRYWLDGSIRALTAVASLGTAFVLPRFVPVAVTLLQGAQRMRREGVALEKAMADLANMYQRTRELDQLKTDFFANVSHELRTPLTLILAPVDNLMRRTDVSPEALEQLHMVRRNAAHLLQHVNDLLDVQKLDAGKLAPKYTEIDMAQLVRGTSAQFDSLLRERNITLTMVLPEQLLAQVDEEKMHRVCLNLLSNALKFTPDGGTISIQLRSQGQGANARVVLCVSDSGPGVLPEDRERIFERFSQGTSGALRRAAGTGLGLAIVRELVELHGGDVSVESAEHGGALFRVRWPLLAPAQADVQPSPVHTRSSRPPTLGPAPSGAFTLAEPGSTPSADDEAGETTLRKRARVLVAEDNDDLRRLLHDMLSPRYRVLMVRNGAEALVQARAQAPDLIISDVMMPELGGEELVHRVRRIPSLDAVPILLLTAKADEELRARVLRSGAQDYLLKPFEREELLARVQNLVAMRRTRVLLQTEVEAQQVDVEVLSREVISQKRKLEDALNVMQHARETAELANRQKSDFLSLVSHELRTPLTSIRLQVERLNRGRDGELTEEQTAIVARIERSSARLLSMVESLLQFGRAETGHLEVAGMPLDVLEVARDVIEELTPRADEKGLSLRLESSLNSAELVSDPQLVRLILLNLCDNAIKYTVSGEVLVTLQSRENGAVCLAVSDTGPGIAPSAHERVFLPFEQLEHVRHKQGAGVGLGLALVKRVADALKAEVALESSEGGGSTFSVTFRSLDLAQ